MRMKITHLVSVLIVAAILLAALPSPSATSPSVTCCYPVRTRTTTKILTTTTSSVPTIMTTTKSVTTTRHTFFVPTTIQSILAAQTIDSSLDPAPVGGQIASYDPTWLLSLVGCLLAFLFCVMMGLRSLRPYSPPER
jgi:hypothetical protein